MIKVLIVDDDSLTRIGLMSSIEWEENGFQVIGEAESGEEALEMCRRQVPDIMLTDISMAEMNGIELIENIKEKGYDIKIIILTCYENFSFLHKALHMGVEDYILKVGMMPSDILKVLQKVKDKYWSGFLPDKEKDKENNYEKLAYEAVRLEVTMGDNPYKASDFPMYVAKRDRASDRIAVE